MAYTVTTTSQSLDEIITAQQFEYANRLKNRDITKEFRIIVQNLGDYDIYFTFGVDATVSDGVRIDAGGYMSFSYHELTSLNLISDTANNTDVRIAIT